MRLFIALDLDNKEYFSSIQEQIPNDIAKLTLPKEFHLTLKFLGEVSDDKIEEIKVRLEQVEFEPISLTTDNIGVFPNEDYIKVVWIGIKKQEKVKELQQKIEKSLEGLFTEDNRFHPHITLARVKFIKDKKTFKDKLSTLKFESKESSIIAFKLIKSTLTEEGPVYETLAEFS
jgi:2'-5' RNA ligase